MEFIDNGFNVKENYKNLTLDELQNISNSDRLPFSIMFLNIEKNINVSSLIRSAHLLGATNVFIIGSTRFDRRGMVGAQNYTNIIRISSDSDADSITSIINSIKVEYEMDMIFLEQSNNSMDLSSNEFKNKILSGHCCIVVGNEGNGIDEKIISGCDGSVVEIEQLGVIRSLNAAIAGSIVAYKIKEILGGLV